MSPDTLIVHVRETYIATHRITLSIFSYQLYLGIFEDSIKGYNRTCGLSISPASPLQYYQVKLNPEKRARYSSLETGLTDVV
jgi:hypothetical protein